MLWAQSGEGYDPQSPPDPDVYYHLTLEASPRTAGSVSPSSMQSLAFGKSISCSAYPNTGYTFKCWMVGDEVVSTDRYFYYSMPDHDVVLTAHFDREEYNPANPGDPFADGYQHKVNLYATPSAGGSFNSSSFYMLEGRTTYVYAYPSAGFRFVSWKQDGKIVSTENPMEVQMGQEDIAYTAQFVYDPQNPGDPGENFFNPATGELVIDNFRPGYLSSAISAVVNDYSLVTSVKIIGQLGTWDWGFYYRMTNCSLVDLARTTGYTAVPSYAFEGMSALKKVILPATVESIGNYAFTECTNLSELVCYALVPPAVDEQTFYGVSNCALRVPSGVIALYAEAPYWSEFLIFPLDEETCKINVNLPADAKDGRYKNMTIELDNISSGQVLKYLITDKTQYVFSYLIKDTKYNIFVKNAAGVELGAILDVEVGDKDANVTFESLLQPKTVSLSVIADGKDVTNDVAVTWTDNAGKYLGQGSNLSGILEGTELVYSISLSNTLGSEYVNPFDEKYTVSASSNEITCTLRPFAKVDISGTVKDLTTGSTISNATISVSQQLNGKYSKSQIVRTDNDGKFSATVYDSPASVTVAANNYLSQTFEIDDVAHVEMLDEVTLKGITGAVIMLNLNYSKSGANPNEEEWYSDYNNVDYSIYNRTKQSSIGQFNVQYPQIVLLEEVSEGDVLELTATSKTGTFMPVVATATIDAEQRANAIFNIVELGKIQANFAENSNPSVVGILYDAKGKLVKTYNYKNASLTISNLQDGNYTLVSMGGSKLFNTIYDLSQFPQTGLVLGNDYVQQSVDVKSGKITHVVIEEVPLFDESKLYYTGDNTMFAANKFSIVVGNYLTLTGNIDFKLEYASEVSNVNLIVDMPESCSFVEGSVMVGNNTSSYTLQDNRLTIPLAHYSDRVRFCIIPTLDGDYTASALCQFDIEGETITQPIGSVNYQAKGISINVPTSTANTTIPVGGTATADSSIEIYDGDVLIGQTTALANGTWSATCELNDAFNLSIHKVYAKIRTTMGLELKSETIEVTYDVNLIVAEKITMHYYNPEMGAYNIVFDLFEDTASTSSYYFFPYKTWPNWVGSGTEPKEFSFIVDLSCNDPARVQEVSVKVRLTDDKTDLLAAYYSEKLGKWVASAYYEESALPVGVEAIVLANKIHIEDRRKFDDERKLIEGQNEENRQIAEILSEECDNIQKEIERNEQMSLYFEDAISRLDNAPSSEEKDNIIAEIYEKVFGTPLVVENNLPNIITDEFVDTLIAEANSLLAERDNLSEDSLSDDTLIYGEEINLEEVYDFINTYGNAQDCNYQLEGEDGKVTYKKMSLEEFAALKWECEVTSVKMTDGSSLSLCVAGDNTAVVDSLREEVWVLINETTNGSSSINNKAPEWFGNSIENITNHLQGIITAASTGVKIYIDDVQGKIDELEETIKIFQSKHFQLQSQAKAIQVKIWRVQCLKQELEMVLAGGHNKQEFIIKSQIESLQKELGALQLDLHKTEKAVSYWQAQESAYKTKKFALTKVLGQAFSLYDVVHGLFVIVDYAWHTRDEITRWNALIGKIEPCEDDEENAAKLAKLCQQNLDEACWKKGFYPAISIASISEALSICSNVNKLNFLLQVVTGILSPFVSNFAEKFYNSACNYSERMYASRYYEYTKLKCKKPVCENTIEAMEGNSAMRVNGPRKSSGCEAGAQCICPPNYCRCKECKKKKVKPVHDPSGYVYEGVSSNRLEGVTATAFYKEQVEDMYGDLHDNIVKWDAEEYAQQNPLFTDENGMYAWDVPQGLWQVKFEKEGYETTYSEWLPVPPPQLDVNIAMTQVRQPEVKSARAYEDAVEVEFDKYMIPATLTEDNIYVIANGKKVEGTILLLNEEVAYEGKAEKYASKIRFNANAPFAAKEVTLTVANRVKSYAGIQMQESFSQTFDVEQEVKSIETEANITVTYDGDYLLTVKAMPAAAAAGKTLLVRSSSSMIATTDAESYILDKKGEAQVLISGELPGTTGITFTIDGYDLSVTTMVNVKMPVATDVVATPTASIASGTTIERGTKVVLSCETPDATIYYTLDGSCPCDEDTRLIYTAPIVINESVTIKAMAVAPDMEDSDVAEFCYIVKQDVGIDEVTLDENLKVYPLPVRDKLNVTAGGEVIKSVTLVSTNGSVVAKAAKPETIVTLDVSTLAPGIYFINVATEDKNYSRKIMKVE